MIWITINQLDLVWRVAGVIAVGLIGLTLLVTGIFFGVLWFCGLSRKGWTQQE